MPQATVRGLLWSAAAGLIFSVLNALMRALALHLDPFQAQFLRYLFGLGFAPSSLVAHSREPAGLVASSRCAGSSCAARCTPPGWCCGSGPCRASRWPT